MIAHALTTLRLLIVAPVAFGIARPGSDQPLWLLAGIGLAIATDYADGIVARRTGSASPRGQLYDHATDFLFVTAGLFGAAVAGAVPVALPVLIVLAFGQYVTDSYWLHRERRLRASSLGRLNGILYFVPLVLIAVSRFESVPGGAATWAMLVGWLSYALIVSTVASIIDRATAPLRSVK